MVLMNSENLSKEEAVEIMNGLAISSDVDKNTLLEPRSINVKIAEDYFQTFTIVAAVKGDGECDEQFNSEEMNFILILSQLRDYETPSNNAKNNDRLDLNSVILEDENGKRKVLAMNKNAEKVLKKKGISDVNFYCTKCNYETSCENLWVIHTTAHLQEKLFICNICSRSFKKQSFLQNHLNMHTGAKPFACKFCAMRFTSQGAAIRHTKYKHTFDKRFKCSECNYTCVERPKLARHFRIHTGEKPFSCPHCSYTCVDEFKLKRHLRIHNDEKPYVCEVCQRRFNQANSLKSHLFSHSDKTVGPFNCTLCSFQAFRKNELRSHYQRWHTNSKDGLGFKCSRCPVILPDKFALSIHKEIHINERCFKCSICSYSAFSQYSLKTHFLIHTNTTPFKCDICSKGFRQKNHLLTHLYNFHQPLNTNTPNARKYKAFCCKLCNRVFAYNRAFQKHLSQHGIVDRREDFQNYSLFLGNIDVSLTQSNEQNNEDFELCGDFLYFKGHNTNEMEEPIDSIDLEHLHQYFHGEENREEINFDATSLYGFKSFL